MDYRKKYLFLLVSMILVSSLPIDCRSKLDDFDGKAFGCDKDCVEKTDYFKTEHNTHITTLANKDGKKYIVKQDSRNQLSWHMSVARDMLGSYIAQSVDVPANKVEIIPSYSSFPGKKNNYLPATLHEVVPGIKLTHLPPDLREFKVFIQQPVKATVPEKSWGLTRRVIQNMARHKDLPKIVALDTFIANADRHGGNFFYCSQANRYYAIDLESSFDKNLARYACSLIRAMLDNQDEIITEQELEGLYVYHKTLKRLLKRHSPESIYEKLHEFSLQGGLVSRSARKIILSKLDMYQGYITENYASCEKLVILLDKLMLKHRAKK
ncbi:MAG: hypothetical protein NT124_03915 [Candidatus Dependentiae bacterium]|nr:hypothetical protein [Candidatus Dependentiae bacterium]